LRGGEKGLVDGKESDVKQVRAPVRSIRLKKLDRRDSLSALTFEHESSFAKDLRGPWEFEKEFGKKSPQAIPWKRDIPEKKGSGEKGYVTRGLL